jgi:hypothetical protein
LQPKLTGNSIPTRINIGATGAIPLQTVASGFNVNQPIARYVYTVKTTTASGSSQVVDVSSIVAPGAATNQPNLVVQIANLGVELQYVFRVTAVVNCLDGQDSFKEWTFTTNGPPQSGIMSVSPLTGVALRDDFTLSASSFIDSDLPLSISFEIRTSFQFDDLREFSTLSAYSTAINTVTKFSEYSRLAIMARARDSLGAITPRASCPIADNITVTAAPPITASTLPFNASESLSLLTATGGTAADALRLAGVYASGSSSTESTDPAVVEWQRQTQATLLDVVGSSLNSTTVDVTDPSVAMLQASTLSTILDSASTTQNASSPEGEYDDMVVEMMVCGEVR